MDLTEEQKKALAQWIEEGLGLSDIQRKLEEELSLPMTYMDVRFLVLDSGLEVKDKEVPKPPEPKEVRHDINEETAGDAQLGPTMANAEASSAVSVDLDRVMKPGAVVSGTVVFGDGVTASWSLDQLGRLALEASQEGYRPSEDDLVSFQKEIKSALETRGF